MLPSWRRGNNDAFTDRRLAPRQIVDLEGWRIGVVHDLTPEGRPLRLLRDRYFGDGVEVMVAGHTHLERIVHEHGLTLVNAGSPILPHHKETRLGCVGLLELTADSLRVEIVPLGETPGRPNPTRRLAVEVQRMPEPEAIGAHVRIRAAGGRLFYEGEAIFRPHKPLPQGGAAPQIGVPDDLVSIRPDSSTSYLVLIRGEQIPIDALYLERVSTCWWFVLAHPPGAARSISLSPPTPTAFGERGPV